MKHPIFPTALLSLAALPQVFAQSPVVTYIPNSTVKLYQVNGDCDWVEWDAAIGGKSPTCKPTTSKTLTNADILGDDVPVAFENNGELMVTFGDTIGAAGYAAWADVQNSFLWQAHDPIGRSTTVNASDGLLIDFYPSGANHALEVLPPPQPNGTPVDMGTDNTPSTGVSVNGAIYLAIKTGNVNVSPGVNNQTADYSVLTAFNESSLTFTSGRTISALPNGHFVRTHFYLAQPGQLGTPPPVSPEPAMLVFGLGLPHASNIYLSIIPSSEFWTGLDQNGNSATRYFAGASNGQPGWSSSESAAVPIVNDVDPLNPTITDMTAFYSQQLGLWLMTFNGGANSVYLTYAQTPWGPWSAPQAIFNPCRDKGFGNFMFYYYATEADNTCPAAMPAGVASAPNSSGPAGPTIGDQTANNPTTTRGFPYAPCLIERFTVISGNTLKLFYMMSTWNPYATVMMESDFNIAYGPAISVVANAEGESPTIAPNTWVEIKGVNLAPSGDSRSWQGSDFVGNQMPTQLDRVSATVNGKNAYVYYISPAQIDILTPPDAMTGPVPVVVTNNGTAAAAFTAQAQSISPSFFVFNGGPYAIAEHSNGSLIGPASLYPGSTTPAKPGETIVLYANGFGPTSAPVVSGDETQTGTLSPLPTIEIGGVAATVTFAGLVAPGEFQFNAIVPASLANGDQPIAASYKGSVTQAGTLLTIQQ
jgi:uncharacterized protein (TIGR03437 family)